MYIVGKQEAQSFEFQVGDKTYSVPRRASLPVKKFREIRKRINEAEDQEEAAIDVIFDLFDEYAPGVIDSMSFEQAINLVSAYTNDGENLGESSPSSD